MKMLKSQRWAQTRRLSVHLICIVTPLYLLLATPVWNYAYGWFLEKTQLASVNDDPTKNPWCAFGNQVLYTFQPMVSDDEMIAHWRANRQQLEALVYQVRKEYGYQLGPGSEPLEHAGIRQVGVAQYLPVPVKSSLHENLVKGCARKLVTKEGDVRSDWECLEGGAAPAANLVPNFGKTAGRFFCSTPYPIQKRYEFFLDASPQIQHGRLYPLLKDQIPPTSPEMFSWIFRNTKGVPLTQGLDRVPAKECALRQLDARWYISLCQD